MKTIEAIEARRSIKQYDSNHKMSQEEIDKLFSAAILSPTSFNIQNWRFLAVTDQAIKDKLRVASWNQEQISNCSLLVVICADLKAWAKNPERYWKNAPESAQNVLVPMIGKFYTGNEELQRDEAMRSGGMAAQTIMLLAKEMGYDTNPMIGFDPQEVAKIINLPEDHVIVMMIPIGKAIQEPKPRGGQLALQEVLFFDQF
jgi:nitroreductase